jgi:hypothetical protein
MQRQCERHQLGCSAARVTVGPTASLEAPLRGAVAAARGSAPGEDREGRLATSRCFEAWGPEAGESWHRSRTRKRRSTPHAAAWPPGWVAQAAPERPNMEGDKLLNLCSRWGPLEMGIYCQKGPTWQETIC